MRGICSLLLIYSCFAGYAPSASSQPTTHRHLEQTHIPVRYENLESWLGRAGWLRDHIRVSNGLWPMPAKTDLNPQFREAHAFDGYAVQGVLLETMPGFFLAGTLYKPTGPGPFPAILSAHGHWSTGRFEHSDLASVPGRAIHLARQGFLVFSYSMIGYNELNNDFPHRFDAPAYQLWGFSASGLQTWNSLRALDFVADLEDVDPTRIGMTGASGGATQTFLLSAIDERIRAAVPVNMISAHFQGGCICENAPALRLDANNVEIGALLAPRPLLMVSTSGDWTTNTPDVEYPAIQEIYRLFDASDRVNNVHLDYPHNYNRDSRNAMYAWFGQWLGNTPPPETEALTMPPQDQLMAPTPAGVPAVEALFARYRQAEIERQQALLPDTWEKLDAFRKTYATPLEHALYPVPSPVQPALEFVAPESRSQATRARLIVHDASGAPRAREIAADLAARGIVAALINPFEQVHPVTPPDSIDYWTTYNPTRAALHIQVIRSGARILASRSDVLSVDLQGVGAGGPLALLARPGLPFIEATHIDFNGRAYEADEDFLETLYMPLLRKAGDFRTATALIFPAQLSIENLPAGKLQTWIRALYANFDAEALLTIR